MFRFFFSREEDNYFFGRPWEREKKNISSRFLSWYTHVLRAVVPPFHEKNKGKKSSFCTSKIVIVTPEKTSLDWQTGEVGGQQLDQDWLTTDMYLHHRCSTASRELTSLTIGLAVVIHFFFAMKQKKTHANYYYYYMYYIVYYHQLPPFHKKSLVLVQNRNSAKTNFWEIAIQLLLCICTLLNSL